MVNNNKNIRGYRTMKSSEVLLFNQLFPDLIKASKWFNKNFKRKYVYYCSDSRKLKVSFEESNFMHLTGVYYIHGAVAFFNDCLENKVDLDGILIKTQTDRNSSNKESWTFTKLRTLKSIGLLLTDKTRIVYKKGKYINLEYNYAVRSGKMVIALTLVADERTHRIVPNSLLGLNTKGNFDNGLLVEAIYSTDYSDDNLEVLYCKGGYKNVSKYYNTNKTIKYPTKESIKKELRVYKNYKGKDTVYIVLFNLSGTYVVKTLPLNIINMNKDVLVMELKYEQIVKEFGTTDVKKLADKMYMYVVKHIDSLNK